MQQITDTISLEYLRPEMEGAYWRGKITDEIRIYQTGVDGYRNVLVATPEADYRGVSANTIELVAAQIDGMLDLYLLSRKARAQERANLVDAVTAWISSLGLTAKPKVSGVCVSEAANTITLLSAK